MKIPAICTLLLFTLTLGCSDESTFAGSAVKVPSAHSGENPAPAGGPEAIPPDGNAIPEPTEVPPTTGESPIASIPEVPQPTLPNAQIVTKVGVNFEDQPGNDADFNDAVLCFKGGFEVTPSIIQSTETQTVEAVLFTEALCTNFIIVRVTRGDQIISSNTYDPRTTHTASLQFAKGDRLDVSLVSSDCDAGAIRPMTDPNYAKLAPDVCNVQ